MVSNLLTRFKEDNPDYILMIVEYPDKITESKLAENKTDIAFITGPIFHQDIQSKILCEEECFVCVPNNHPFAEKTTIQFDDLIEERFLTMNDEYKTYDCYVRHMNEKSSSPKIVFSASTLAGLKEALILNQGITIINPQYDICPPNFVKVKCEGIGNWRLSIAINKTNSTKATLKLYHYVLDNKHLISY